MSRLRSPVAQHPSALKCDTPVSHFRGVNITFTGRKFNTKELNDLPNYIVNQWLNPFLLIISPVVEELDLAFKRVPSSREVQHE